MDDDDDDDDDTCTCGCCSCCCLKQVFYMLDNCFKFTRRILKYTIAYGSFFCIFLSYWRCDRNISRSKSDPVLLELEPFRVLTVRLGKDIVEVVAFEIPWNASWQRSRCLVHEKNMDRSSWWFQPSCNTELFVKVDQSAIEENWMKFVWTTGTIVKIAWQLVVLATRCKSNLLFAFMLNIPNTTRNHLATNVEERKASYWLVAN